MADLQVQPSINDTRAQALLALIERLGEIDLSPLLVYRMASVSDSALPFLAWQFDVLSPLWQLLGPIAGSIDALTDIDPLTDIDSMGGAVFGSTAAQRALLATVGLGTMLAVYAAIVPLEEAYLRDTFGAEFDAYVERVPRIVPQLAAAQPQAGTYDPAVIAAAETRTFVTFGAMLVALALKALSA